jgi:hypothetical protein
VESGIGRWCSGVDKVVVSCALAKHEGGEGVGPKPETEPLWLGLGRAVWNGDRGWCLGVGWWHVPGGGGGGVVRHVPGGGGGGVVWLRNTRRGGGFG